EVFDNHHLLKAGFWKAIKVALKTHKYTLVPKSHFIENAVRDYLLVNSELKPGLENAMYYKHISSDAVNVFAGDMRLLRWIKTIYPNKQITVAHQGSAFIEGLLRQDDHPHNKAVFCLIEKGILHVVVTSKQNLLYYNQFAIKQNEEYLKYLLLVFRELSLDQKSTRVIVWGNLKPDSQLIGTLKKYIRDISFGNRPSFLKFNYHFDEISDHQYFDLFNIFLCD
ncbi:MAG: DUF3822 family protein, partial [Cyclobacteriaceae bacterium]|nr:DUF3822 family protein [Cyclobacteriaceae bacterium]